VNTDSGKREARRSHVWRVTAVALFVAFGAWPQITQADDEPTVRERVARVVLLRDYNTRVVLAGSVILGATAGVVGVFTLLRRRALIGDVVGHSALPGIALAFLIGELIFGHGRSLPLLLSGAFLAGLAAAGCVMALDRVSRIRSDAALAVVLSGFYGAGAVLLSVVQQLPTGAAAGLSTYLNGQTATIVAADVWLFACSAAVVLAVTLALFKEFTLLCFDMESAAADGWPVRTLDALLIVLVAAVTIIGMQSVGLILVVATLITPAAASRFWTDNIRAMTVSSAAIGGTSAAIGVLLSAAAPHVAAGAVIVIIAGLMFVVSLLFGKRRGVVWRWLTRVKLRRRIGRHDLLRAIYEQLESVQRASSDAQFLAGAVPLDDLIRERPWTGGEVGGLIKWATRDGLVTTPSTALIHLTPHGLDQARRLVRNHRLWEIYLIRYADVAPTHVDRGADLIEHVLDEQIIRDLERHLPDRTAAVPASPHALTPADARESLEAPC